MDKKTEIFVDAVSIFLRDLMKQKRISAEQLSRENSINKQQLYSVLRMGSLTHPDYKVSTLVKVLSALDVHLEFYDKAERSNFDLLPESMKPGKN